MEEKKREMNPNSLANLVPPVRPGEIRNPTGKNGAAYSAEYHRVAHEIVPEEARAIINKKAGCELVKAGDTWARANSLAMHHAACCGLVNAVQEVRESTEGKAVQRVQMSGTEGAEQHPTFRVVFTDDVLELSDGRVTPDDLSGK
jgi:hypothetical protein